jgi:hypothetical protein
MDSIVLVQRGSSPTASLLAVRVERLVRHALVLAVSPQPFLQLKGDSITQAFRGKHAHTHRLGLGCLLATALLVAGWSPANAGSWRCGIGILIMV